MDFVPGQTLRGVDGGSEIARHTLPFFVGAPVGIRGAHFFFGGFATSPMGDLGIEGDGYVLEHRISVTRIMNARDFHLTEKQQMVHS
jgi:hypothetical protein